MSLASRAPTMTLRAQIEEAAMTLGFDAIGVAPAERAPTAAQLSAWIDAGHAGEMAYMAADPERRADPRVYWPQARSLVMCLKSYAPDPAPDPDPLNGRVAAYAWGKDYHDVLKKALHGLGKAIEQMMPGVTYRAVIDTSALLERAHAANAGLGWVAKNTMLLSRAHGSFTLIGAVLLDKALPPDGPVTSHCGSCTACIDACPTGALLKPYVLDSRRCISYLTIELRGHIPEQHRRGMGSWVFGCDICQQVCPWVKKAGPARDPGPLGPIGDRPSPSLPMLVNFDAPAFAQWAQRSPIKRAKLQGLQRNAAVCLGNSPDREGALAALGPALSQNPEPTVRAHAAWAIGAQGGPTAVRLLEAARRIEVDEHAQAAIQSALSAPATSHSEEGEP